MRSMIECQDLEKSFVTPAEVVTALRTVDLTVERGTFLAISGPSGCGKTTLLNVISGLELPNTGSVHIEQTELTQLSDAKRTDLRLHRIGVVFQDNNLVPEFNCLDNVLLPLEVRGFDLSEARHFAQHALDSMGVGELGRRLPAQISGGQRQRVGIARALAGDKPLLVADEPTGALDSANSAALFALIRKLCDGGLTAVVASHDAAISQFADRTLAMRDGSFDAPSS